MKQFWLGMTSKIAEVQSNLKAKLSRKPKIEVENFDDPLAEVLDVPPLNEDVNYGAVAKPNREAKPKYIPGLKPVAFEEEPIIYKEKKPLSWGKIITLVVLFIILAGVGAVFYVISNIDWNQHKDKIAQQFSDITGKKIVFDGPVNLTLLPSPYLTAEDIKVYNPGEEGDEPLAKIKSLVANLSLMPLLQSNFDVKMMSLVEPDIRMEMDADGKFNWEGTLTAEQHANLENMEVALDSVMVEKAKLNFIDVARDINLKLDNLNAEIIAQSIFGPYRIEGTYLKDNNPEGFAFSIGKVSSTFATTLNLVINQPTTETFLRFDGSVLPQNNAINGKAIFESKKLMPFINSNFKDFSLAKEYDYPLAVSLDIKSNKTKIELSNFVMKYGDTAGAGNLLIPLGDEVVAVGEEKPLHPKAELVFNFTDLNFAPIYAYFKSQFAKYNTPEATYNPSYNFDLLADIKAVKTRYNDQVIKDFKLSFDLIDNNINIGTLSAVLPGDTDVVLKGRVYPDLGHLTYNFDTSLKTDEFLETLKWLNIKPQTSLDTVLRRISATAKVAGNFQKIGINPLDVRVDKSSIKGEIGMINSERPSLYLRVSSDMINFDNYLVGMPKEIAEKSFAEKMTYRFGKLAFLNDYEVDLKMVLDLGIYESMPFENTKLEGNLRKGVFNIKDLSVASAANAVWNFKGILKGFGETPKFENLKYEVASNDFASLLSKLDFKAPNIDFKKLKVFSSKGIATGSLDKLAVKTVSKLDVIAANYGGQIYKKEGQYLLNGDLDIRSPDFVKMLNDFNVPYSPKAFSLGLFNLKTKVVGTPELFTASDVDVNIGPNSFKGNVIYDETSGRKKIVANLDINKLEFEKFFYNDALIKESNSNNFRGDAPDGAAEFLNKSIFDKAKLNYNFYKTFDLSGHFNISRLNYRDYIFDYAIFDLSLVDTFLKVSGFKSDYHGGKLDGDFEMGLADKPFMRGNVNVSQYKIVENTWNGSKYGIKDGSVDAKIKFDMPADSFDDMYSHFNGDAQINVYNGSVLGWNLNAIYKDLLKRETSDGLTSFVKNNLQSGEEYFASMTAGLMVKDGQYTIKEARFEANNLLVTMNDQGNINTWDNNAQFAVKYDKPDYLPGFSFGLSGSLIAPTLEVNTEELATMYNGRQAELEAQNDAVKKAEIDRLAKLMDDQMLVVKSEESEIQNVIKQEIASRKAQVSSPEVVASYQELEGTVNKLEASVAELLLMAKTPNIDEKLIELVKEKNVGIVKELQVVKAQINLNNIGNAKYVINNSYNQLLDQNNQAKKISGEYRNEYSDLGKRLNKIETSYKLNNDSNIRRIRDQIEGNVLALDNITNSVQADFVQRQGSNNLAELEKYAGEIERLVNDAARYMPALTAAKQELFTYAGERITMEEEAYQKRKAEEEIKRKVEENTGSISIKGSGVSKTVVRDIEEIQKSEAAVDKNDVKILDFSEEKKPEVNRVINTGNSQPVVREAPEEVSGVISKSDGKISKATGVIIKK